MTALIIKNFGGDEWIRTTVPFWGADLQSAAINHSATSPNLNTLQKYLYLEEDMGFEPMEPIKTL